MADPNSPQEIQEFIVQGEPVKSGQLADHLSREPSVKRIGQVAPDVVILSMTKTQADHLRSTFSTIVVEPNAPLKSFGAG